MKAEVSLLATLLLTIISACTAPSIPDGPAAIHTAQPQPEPAEELKQKIDKLVAQLADEKFTVREAADEELRSLLLQLQGAEDFNAILSYLKRHLDTTTDPEVKIRLERMKIEEYIEIVRREAAEALIKLGTYSKQLKIVPMPKVTIKMHDADLRVVLNQIAAVGGAKIFIAPDVIGKVSVNLKNVPWRTAFDTVVKTLGYVVIEEDDNILRVVRPEE